MKILFQSFAFYPSTGGIESSADLLLQQFTMLGHEVRVHTMSPLDEAAERTQYLVTRQPKATEIIRDLKWADLLYQHNPSMRLAWPSEIYRIPTVVSIHTWIRRSETEKVSLVDHLKLRSIRRHTVISNSHATAQHLGFSSIVIENAYDDQLFRLQDNSEERSGMVFVGRLVSDKGCITAIETVARLASKGKALSLTVVGDGPEKDSLIEKSIQLGISERIHFVGRKSPTEVAQILNHSLYQLIPSLWEEPFGIVALEGIACGCIPIATNHGGLVDAVGECGALFPPGDIDAMVDILLDLESNPSRVEQYRLQRFPHLERHNPSKIAKAYLDVFQSAITRKR